MITLLYKFEIAAVIFIFTLYASSDWLADTVVTWI